MPSVWPTARSGNTSPIRFPAATAIGFGWKATPDSQATAGKQALRCGYGNGNYTAKLPPLALGAGKYQLKLAARLSVDSSACSKGSLTVTVDGQAVHTLCTSGAHMQPITVEFTLAAANKHVAIALVFNPTSGKPDGARGAWVDDLQLRPLAPTNGCSCNP